jgi:hypothetical protein
MTPCLGFGFFAVVLFLFSCLTGIFYLGNKKCRQSPPSFGGIAASSPANLPEALHEPPEFQVVLIIPED